MREFMSPFCFVLGRMLIRRSCLGLFNGAGLTIEVFLLLKGNVPVPNN
jgi:hypothetical protein